MSGLLAHNVVLFGRVLHGAGLEAGPGRVAELLESLGAIGFERRDDVRSVARCLFARRREDLGVVDAAFDVFWRRHAQALTDLDLRAMGERRLVRPPRFEAKTPETSRAVREDGGSEGEDDDAPRFVPILTWSAREVLRHKDFGVLSPEEHRQVREAIAGLRLRVRERPSRRRRPGPRGEADLLRTLRRSQRHGFEVLQFERRARKLRPRPLVVLADVSGSMERYTRPFLLFMYALAAGPRTEAFTFGTRLTRVTPALRRGDLDRALREVARAVPDWSGGTRIGDSLHEFGRVWGKRVLSRGAVVLLLSDGWDRGEPELLRREMARLQRSAWRLVWLNPLLGGEGYEPLARGMQAAIPYVDDFLPVHNLASLETLAAHLASLSPRRSGRRARQAPGPAARGTSG